MGSAATIRKGEQARERYRNDLAALRAWYAEIQQRIKEDGRRGVRDRRWSAGEVVASWARMARPFAEKVAPPSPAERGRNPGRYLQADDGTWWLLSRDGPTGPQADGPKGVRPAWQLSFDRAGPCLWSAGRTVRDRERARAMLHADDWVHQFIDDFFPSARAEGARKGSQPEAVARALLLWSLRQRLGLRPAARLVIVWDQKLQTPFADDRAADLIRRYEDGDLLNEEERRTRTNLESTVIKTSQRVWERTGLDSVTSLRI
jgi:hypothetical protein